MFFQNGGSGHLGFKKKASSRISKKKLKFFLLDSYESIEAKKLASTRDCKVKYITRWGLACIIVNVMRNSGVAQVVDEEGVGEIE